MAYYADRDFITIYRKDYGPKCYCRVLPCPFKSDYKDIIRGPFTEFVSSPAKKTDFGEKTRTEIEKLDECRKRLLSNHPKLIRYLEEEIDENKLSDPKDGKTIYQKDYCKPEDKFESKKTLDRRRETLPSDWADIPATVQKASYRDFKKLVNWNVVPEKIKLQPSVFQPNYKERKILKVRTGESEYEGKISALGETIINDNLHGKLFDSSDICAMIDEIDLRRTEGGYVVRAPYQQQ
ncbi:hypothetical protein LSTR_LSTR009581 [Laodelphax striatellus]|uniref:Uncharacterized protein n=1 Tax=Laodelphax striatellus TaxID=195883 RepID=A0A482WQD0_LAOST|nr:hypothetical protein LSTR_LSTR009581 [Laodelphax striatellus]